MARRAGVVAVALYSLMALHAVAAPSRLLGLDLYRPVPEDNR